VHDGSELLTESAPLPVLAAGEVLEQEGHLAAGGVRA
jgi:hypothetical protein